MAAAGLPKLPWAYSGGFASAERDEVGDSLREQKEEPRLWEVSTENQRIIGYGGHLPREVRSGRERSSADISSALYEHSKFVPAGGGGKTK